MLAARLDPFRPLLLSRRGFAPRSKMQKIGSLGKIDRFDYKSSAMAVKRRPSDRWMATRIWEFPRSLLHSLSCAMSRRIGASHVVLDYGESEIVPQSLGN